MCFICKIYIIPKITCVGIIVVESWIPWDRVASTMFVKLLLGSTSVNGRRMKQVRREGDDLWCTSASSVGSHHGQLWKRLILIRSIQCFQRKLWLFIIVIYGFPIYLMRPISINLIRKVDKPLQKKKKKKATYSTVSFRIINKKVHIKILAKKIQQYFKRVRCCD